MPGRASGTSPEEAAKTTLSQDGVGLVSNKLCGATPHPKILADGFSAERTWVDATASPQTSKQGYRPHAGRMCPRTSAPNPSMKKCWPCRRRRLKCDGGLPGCRKCRENGVECTYTKPLTWVGGVASRGHMVNSTFDRMYEGRRDAAVTSGPYVPGSSDNRPGLSFRPSDFDEVTNLDVLPELSRGLTDPLFQDLGYNSRFLVDYCKNFPRFTDPTRVSTSSP